MPFKSEAQRRLFEAVAHGNAKVKGLSPDEARDFIAHSKGEYEVRKSRKGKMGSKD